MRNLVPLVVSRLDTADEIPLPLSKVAVDQDFVFCCFVSPDDDTVVLQSWSPQTKWDARVEWPLPTPTTTITGLKGDSIDSSAVVIMSNGDVVTVSLLEGSATIVGSLEQEISACEWSPDGEVLCILLASGRVLFLSSAFEELKEHTIGASDLELAEKHVTVGWGKRETQFQGRGAKRDPTLLDRIETRERSPSDDGLAHINWRGDGEFVVINALDSQSNKRALRVFTRGGELSSVSEPVDHILGLVAWQPMGALIACVKHSSNGGCVQFFERNGLRRHAFDIPDSHEVTSLAWSSDSAILSVAYRSRIDLWTTKNYHWYLKQSITVPCVLGIEPMWHPEKPGTLIIPSENEIQFRTYRFTYNSQEGLVAVIDHNEVKVTPLAYANVPPPLEFASILLSTHPQAVAVSAPTTIAVATNQDVRLFNLNLEDEELEETSSWKVPGVKFLSFSGNQLLAATEDDILLELVTSGPANDGEAIPIEHQPPSTITALSGGYYLCNSQAYTVTSGELIADFGAPCLDLVVKDNHNAFALSRTGKLLHGSTGTVLNHNVTSMALTGDHLLFTTLTRLTFVHLAGTNTSAPAVPDDDDLKSEQSREIERGSLIVSVVPSAMTTVLQAPRGNIETIYPRMLVLGHVRRCVAAKEYAQAFQTCKVHRIDMSILYDLNPEQFLSQIPQIISGLGSDTQVDLLLSAMSDEDVTQTKYVDTSITEKRHTGTVVNKANKVLDEMLPHLSAQSTITALALKQPPQLAEALVSASKDEKLVKHLCFLCDTDKLYKTALSVYNPALALVVAQQAQMDPKEYLPFLRARQSESIHRRRFNIDLYLRQYSKALQSLVEEESTENDGEIVEFVNRHELHAEALNLLRHSERSAKYQIMEAQAERWYTSAKYTDAGQFFELLGQRSRAIEAYVLGGDWRKALALTSEPTRNETAAKLVEGLEANKQFSDAAHLFAYYLNDPLRALECYCQANQFDDAVLVGRMHQLDSKLEETLRESYATFQELLADCARQIPAQLRRLRELRAKRDEDTLGFEHQMEDLDVADNLSVAGTETTNASIFTRYTDKSSVGTAATNATRRTAKNQRRQERKRARGKKGSVYEEEYLISSTGRLVERLKHVRSDLQGLVAALQRCNLSVYAGQLVTEDGKILDLLREILDEVYTVDERALLRYDESGHEYMTSAPVKPEVPEAVHF